MAELFIGSFEMIKDRYAFDPTPLETLKKTVQWRNTERVIGYLIQVISN
jgi:hypothetical protein